MAQNSTRCRLGEQGLVSLAGTKPGWLDKLREIPMCGRITHGESVTTRVRDSVEGQKDKQRARQWVLLLITVIQLQTAEGTCIK